MQGVNDKAIDRSVVVRGEGGEQTARSNPQ